MLQETGVPPATMVTDGAWAQGEAPSAPRYVAGVGHMQQYDNLHAWLSTNTHSTFYHAPNPWQLAQVFNDIRALPGEIGLVANDATACAGADYYTVRNQVTAGASVAQISVVWSDPACRYTCGRPVGKAINVTLIDPDGNISPVQPALAAPGYAIFLLVRPQPGIWQALVQFDLETPVWTTVGGMEFGSEIRIEVEAPRVLRTGNLLKARVRVLDGGTPVEGLRVRAQLARPAAGWTFSTLPAADNGVYTYTCADTFHAGAYDVVFHIDGANPASGRSFTRNKRFSTLVL